MSARIGLISVQTSVRFLLAGMFLGFSFWCRLNSGILATLFIVFILIVLFKAHKEATSIALGFSSIAALGLMTLGIFGASSSFVDQALVWPIRWSREIVGSNSLALIGYGLFFVALPSFLIFFAIFLTLTRTGWTRVSWLILCLISWLFLSELKKSHPTNSAYWESDSNRHSLFGVSSVHFLWIIILLSCWQLAASFNQNQLSISRNGLSFRINHQKMATIVPLGLLTGVFPIPDRAHIWLVVLPALGGVVNFVVDKVTDQFRKGIMAVLAVSVLCSSFVFEIKDNFERPMLQKWTMGNMLDGMLERMDSMSIRQEQISSIMGLQSQFGPRSVLTVCQDALYSTLGTNSFPDPYLIYWGPIGEFGFLPSSPIGNRRTWIKRNQPIIYACAPVGNMDSGFEKDLASIDYVIYRRWPQQSGGEWGWPLGGTIAIPRSWSHKWD